MTTQSPADARDQFEIAYATHMRSMHPRNFCTPEDLRIMRDDAGYGECCNHYLNGAWWAWQFLSNAPDAYSPSYKVLYETAQQKVNDLMAELQRREDERQAEEMIRFCPSCGSLGEVGEKYRDCCPDGSHARICADTFQLAIHPERSQDVARVALNDEQRRDIQECIDYLTPAAKDFSDLGMVGMGDSKHARCIRVLRSLLAPQPPQAGASRDDWQQKALDHGFQYWRASDAHGVTGTVSQAVELLQDLLGVEVEIEEDRPTPPDIVPGTECGACAVPAPEQEEVRCNDDFHDHLCACNDAPKAEQQAANKDGDDA